jgi:hypothetical protein
MKKIIFAAFALISSLSLFASDPGVDEKVLEAFNKTFKQAEDVSWTTSGDNFQVKFTQNDIASRVYYDKEGNILKTYRYYKEEGLPLLIFSNVKTKYSDKTIFGVVESSSKEGTYYYITLEGDKEWMEVKADGFGYLQVEKKFKKA